MREAGFTIFYMSINLGSILGFFICGYLGENIGWHYGFGAAGIGMFLGILQYKLTVKSLGKIGLEPTSLISAETKNIYKKVTFFISFITLVLILSGLFGYWKMDPVPLANILTIIITSISLAYFLYIYFLGTVSYTHLTLPTNREV